MTAGAGNFVQTVLHALDIIKVGTCQGCQAHDSIHRRAQIMAHIRQELRLGRAGTLSRLKGILKHSARLTLVLFDFRRINANPQHLGQHAVAPFQWHKGSN